MMKRRYKFRVGKAVRDGATPCVGVKAEQVIQFVNNKKQKTRTIAWGKDGNEIGKYEFKEGFLRKSKDGGYYNFFEIMYIGELTTCDGKVVKLDVYVPVHCDGKNKALEVGKVPDVNGHPEYRELYNKLIRGIHNFD